MTVRLRFPWSNAWGRLELTAGLFVIRFPINELGARWFTIIAEEEGGIYARQVCARARFERAVGWAAFHDGWNVSCMYWYSESKLMRR